MPIGAQRWALAAVVVLLLVSSTSTFGSASPTASNSIDVVVTLASNNAPNAGVAITLTAAGTGQSCTSTTTGSEFVSFGGAQGCTLVPGWYTVSVAAQIDSSTNPWVAVFPSATAAPDTFYASQATLTSGGPEYLTGLTQLVMNQTISGSVWDTTGNHYNGTVGTVELLDPSVPGFVLASQTGFTSGSEGAFTLSHVPAGTWTLYASGQITTGSGTTDVYNYTSIFVSDTHSGTHWQDLGLGNYLVQGNILPTDHFWFYNQTNVTLYNQTTGQLYSFVNPQGQFQQTLSNEIAVGTYNSTLFRNGNVSTHFLVLVAPQGYSTTWTYVNANPATVGTTGPINFHVNDLAGAPATTKDTTINYAGNFSAVNVTSTVTLTNDSVYTLLPNSNLGDLYAQVAMDFGSPGKVNATHWDWENFVNWLNTSGPVYPANQMSLMTNSSSFLENARYQWSQGATPTDLNFTSGSSYWYKTGEEYNLSKGHNPGVGYPSYTVTMGFQFPSAGQSLSYTVNLPRDYTLEANSAVPNGTEILPGATGNFSSFTLVPTHSPTGSPNGTFTFTAVQIQKVTAVVNVNSPNFAFSNKTNVLNESHDNYQVLVGIGQNASFSSIASVFPTGFNATSYTWYWGDGSTPTTTYRENTTAWHYYHSPGRFNATLALLSNSGLTSVQHFIVFVQNAAPTPVITTNDTHYLGQKGNVWVLGLNYSQGIQFNATGSTSKIISGPASNVTVNGKYVNGSLSDAIWNVTSGPTYYTQNYSIGAKAASVFGNVSYEFLGAGNNTNWTDKVYTPSGEFVGSYLVHGWIYKVNLTLYNAGGINASAYLYVLVNDTEKPVSIGAVQGGPAFTPSSGEGKNQTSEVAPGNNTCNVELNQWAYAPHNGTISHYSWEVSSPSNSSFKNRYYNQSTPYVEPQVWLPVPVAAGSTPTPYRFTLNVSDMQGNFQNASYTFSCELNTTTAPILQALNTTVQGGTTLTDGTGYTIQVNITNAGGDASLAKTTSVSWYLQTSAGAAKKGIGGATSWYGFVGGIQNSSAESKDGVAVSSVNIFYNHTYRAEVHFTPGSGLSGSYQLCANASSPSEFPGSYKTNANVYCISVTFNQSLTTEYVVLAAIGITIAVVLIVVLLFLRRRGKSPKKGGAGGKKAKDEDEDEEDEDDDRASRSKGGKDKDKDEDDDDE